MKKQKPPGYKPRKGTPCKLSQVCPLMSKKWTSLGRFHPVYCLYNMEMRVFDNRNRICRLDPLLRHRPMSEWRALRMAFHLEKKAP